MCLRADIFSSPLPRHWYRLPSARRYLESLPGLTYLRAMMSPLGLRIREARRAKGLTQLQLAERSGVQRTTITRLETRRIYTIDLGVLEKLADALGVDAALLIVRETERKAGRGRKKG